MGCAGTNNDRDNCREEKMGCEGCGYNISEKTSTQKGRQSYYITGDKIHTSKGKGE